jgi:ABC-type uncharacterized transport system substrate-binding protein
MKRRAFIIAVTTVLTGVIAGAQATTRRVAVLLTADTPTGRATLAVFQKQLEELGWAVGRNVQIAPYWTGVNGESAGDSVAALLRARPDAIVSAGTVGIRSLTAQKVATIPIVFVQVTDPVEEGFVRSLERPGGNVTGFANFGSDVGAERLKVLTSLAPGITRVMVVRDAGYGTPRGLLRSTEREAAGRDIQLDADGMHDVDELERKIGAFAQTPNGGLVVLSDPFALAYTERIVRLAERHRLAAIYQLASFAEAGGLISYGVNIPVMWRGAAGYVDRILRGARPGDLPVQEPTDPEIVVNLRTATALGVQVPPSILSRATRVIR